MKKRTKLVSIIALSLLFAFSAIGFVGCANKSGVDLTTVDASLRDDMFKSGVKSNFVIESVIDIDDYIVKLDGAKKYSVHFNYEDSNGESKTDVVKGVTYYFMNKGTYEMVYTVALSSGYVRQSMDIEVSGKGLSITTNKYPLVYSLGSTALLKAILVNANPYCSETNDFKFEKVAYYETSFTLDETINEETEYEKSLGGETKINFDKAGTYDFTISCSVDDEYATGVIRVAVVDETKSGNDYVLKNDDGSYASGNAEIDGDIVKLTQADYSSASYLVLDGTYYDEDVIRVDFKGQNCPQIGIMIQPIEGAYNPYALYGGKGFTFSLEHLYKDKFSIYADSPTTGLGRFSGQNAHNGNASTGYFGIENLDKDKYYTLELNLSTTSSPGGVNVFHLAILEIENYGTAEQSYKKVYPTEESTSRYIEVGAGGTKDYGSGNIVFYGSKYDDITFKIYKPTGRIDLDSCVQVGNTVTWNDMEDVVYYVSTDGTTYTMQTENSFTFTEFYEHKTPLYIIAERPESYIAIGRDKDNNRSKNFNAAIYNDLLPEETTPYEDKDGEFIFADTTDSALTKSVDSSKSYVNVTLLKKGQTVLNYVRTKTEYAPGTYAIMEFKGRDFPGMIAFGTKEGTTYTEHNKTVGIGFYLDTNSGGRIYINTTDGETYDPNSAAAKFSTKSYLDRGYLNAGHAAYFGADVIAGNKIRDFVLIAGIDNVDGGIELNYVLFRKAYDDSLELVQDMSYFIEGENLDAGSITIGSTRHFSGATFTYKWYEPQTGLDGALALLEDQYDTIYKRSPLDADMFEFIGNGGVSVNANGTYYTTADDTYDTELSFVSAFKTTFAKTKSSYAPGTYIMTEFVGANAPNGIFFGVQEIGEQDTLQGKWKTVQISGLGMVSDNAAGASYFYKTVLDTSEATTGWLGGASGKFSRGYFIGNEKNFPGSVDNGNKAKTYVLIVGADNTDDGAVLEYLLFEKDSDGVLTFIERRTQNMSGVTLEEGSIAFNTSVNAAISPKFKLYVPDDREGTLDLLNEVYGFDYQDPVLSSDDFTASAGSVTVDQNDTFDNTDDDCYTISSPFGSATIMNYVQSVNSYAPGTYVLMEFLGANAPTNIIFGSSGATSATLPSQNGALFAATGIGLFGDDAACARIYYKTQASTKVSATTTAFSATGLSDFNRGYFLENTGNFPNSTGNKAKTFVLVAGAYNTDDGAKVEYMLFEKDTSTGELSLIEIQVKTISGAQVEEGKIVFANSVKQSHAETFKLYKPNTREEILKVLENVYGVKYQDPVLSSDDFVSSNGAIAVYGFDDDYCTISSPFGSATIMNYVQTAKTYASGTYVLMEFLGANAPTNIIFGSSGATSATLPSQNGALFAVSGIGLFGDDAGCARIYYKTQASTDVSATITAFSATGLSCFTRGYFLENTGNFPNSTGNKAKTFVLLAGAYNTDDGAVVEYSLYEKNTSTGEISLIETQSMTVSGAKIEEGKIVFANSVKASHMEAIKLYEPDTKENLTEKLETLYTLPNE